MIKTQLLSASRAGLGSVIVTDPSAQKTQALSNIGVVQTAQVGAPFVIHPFV